MTSLSSYLLLVGIGILPSLLWLVYWLRKDCHPEPKLMVTKVLLLGIILSPLAIVFQLLFVKALSPVIGIEASVLSDSPWFYLWAAFVEELVKFGVVFLVVLRSPDFDEPVDAMIYMLTAAMGFAAMENILVVNRVIADGLGSTLTILTLRFAGATLLHALSSALLGYFVAMAWFFFRHRRPLFITGLALATVFHWAFNLFVSQTENEFSLVFSTMLLMAMALLVSALFDKIKERDGSLRPSIA
jgi:RsiW-degrading membrane proteinase PrsW (M82 family)